MKKEMSEQRVKELKETFDYYDQNKDGCLDVQELQDCFRTLGLDLSEDAVQDKINEVDYDGNGTIEFNEFKLILSKQNQSTFEDTLRHIFRSFDQDGNGSLNLLEIKRGLEQMGDRVSMSEVEKILESTQIDDGEIYYEDFIKLLTKN